MSDINKGELSFRHLLNRRRWSIEKWAEAENIKTKAQFDVIKSQWVAMGYFFDEVMNQFRDSLPESIEVPVDVKTVESERPVLSPDEEELKPKARKTKGSGTSST